METRTTTTTRVFESLTKGRGTAKETAIRLINSKDPGIDYEQLRDWIIRALKRDFIPPRSNKQKEELKSSDTRCWLLSALGRLANGSEEAVSLLRKHLDLKYETSAWARYWTLEGIVFGQVQGMDELIRQVMEDKEEDLLASSLARVILASKNNDDTLDSIKEKLKTGTDDEKWALLRALRVIPLLDKELTKELCDRVSEGKYSDLTFDSIVVLSRIPANTEQAEAAAQTLFYYLVNFRWPMHEAMRIKAIRGLGHLRIQWTASVLIEELSDDSPAIVYEAARALELILGVPTATARILEATAKSEADALMKFANALRSMKRESVVEELETAMLSGSNSQQEIARTLLSEVGGVQAFQRLSARTKAVKQYIDVLESAETKIRDLFERSIMEARHGFRIATIMDIAVFVVGLGLVGASAWMALSTAGSLDNWAGVGLTGGLGVLGVIYGILIANPRKQIKESVDHLMNLKVVFLAYLRQLHQTDQAYTRRLLDDKAFPADEVDLYSKMVTQVMESAVFQLTGTRRPSVTAIAVNGKPKQKPETADVGENS